MQRGVFVLIERMYQNMDMFNDTSFTDVILFHFYFFVFSQFSMISTLLLKPGSFKLYASSIGWLL